MNESNTKHALYSKPLAFLKGFLLLFVALILVSCNSKTDFSNREQNFDEGWKFYLGDIRGADSAAFDDSKWRTLDLPHDWSIEDLPAAQGKKQIGPFTEDSEGKGSTGHVKGGIGWYRKTFTLDESTKNKKVQLCFDGVYRECNVWLNGQHLGFHAYGYTPFSVNLTPYLKPAGQKNVLAVWVNNPGKNSRWYSGSGIYRSVTLQVTDLVNIPVWGIFITTPEVSAEKATVNVQTAVNNITSGDVEVAVITQLYAPDGTLAAEAESILQTTSGENDTVTQVIEVNTPARWSMATPNLYKAVSEIKYKGKTVDQKSTTFGIRSIEFSAEKGFLLNGERVMIKGGCMHHDNGPLGAAAIERAEERRVELMKQFGFNAIRTAHNPPSERFLNACDRLGILVMDESFDHWQKPKNPDDYSVYFDQFHQQDLEAMVLRDRNHPSIIIWSIGNEIQERADSSGLVLTKRLSDIIKKLDTSRPVTAAICDFWDNKGKTWEATIPAFALLDIGGYNYQFKHYESDHEQFPNRMIIGTESTAREAFESWILVEKHPYVLGDFVWTSMDYLGESGIGRTEIADPDAKDVSAPDSLWYNGYCGDIDICGFKKPQSYYRDVLWKISNLEMAVHSPIPAGKKELVSYWGWPDEHQSWNWKGNEGVRLQVKVYSNYPEVRLELNGKVIGTQPVSADTRLTATFEVPYEAGELKSIALKDGKEMESKVIRTTGAPAKIQLTTDRSTIKANRHDLAYVTVEILDEAGNIVPDAQLPIQFKIEGEGSLAAVENGNPKDMKSFSTPQVNSFKGRCLVILRPSGKAGNIMLKAESAGLAGADLTVQLN
ncbi:MAG TPA: glycoside hydrolase family 2 TIM barrel-domain containing protein [Prolixibacteraceae bacterium]|nr:glycoside hydrolase family 2 TIM barrel-domain containing protein [Prolixibacteraceae bacterium]